MRIFVTYSHEDRVVVDLLIQDICQLGHTVWYDQQLTAGHVWWDEVLQQIISAELIIAAISPAWLRTHSCQLELSYAYELNKRILPIMIAPLDYEILPEILQRLTVIPYIHQQNPMVIAKAIQNLPPERPLPNPLPPPPEAPLSELGRLQQQVRAPHLTFEVQKSLVNHIRWHLYSQDLKEVHQARRLLHELGQRGDIAVIVKQYIEDILSGNEDIDTDKLQSKPQVFDSQEITNPKPLGITTTYEQRRLDVAMPSEVVVGQPTQLWMQLCLPNSIGFRNELAQIPHSGITADPPKGEYKSSTTVRPQRVHVRFEITAVGFQIDEPIHEVLVPSNQDAGQLTITLIPVEVISTGFVRVTAKRLITNEKYVTLGSVALSVRVHDTKTADYVSKKWVLRSLIFAASVLFDDAVQTWGIRQARYETPPVPWESPYPPPAPPYSNRANIAAHQTRYPYNHQDEQTIQSPSSIKSNNSSGHSSTMQLWFIGGLMALVFAIIVGGCIAVLSNNINQTASQASNTNKEDTPASPTLTLATESLLIASTATFTPLPSNLDNPTVTFPPNTEENPVLPTLTSSVLPQIRLRYTAERFTLENITGSYLDISPLSFIGERSVFVANQWMPYVEENTSSSLLQFPSRGCVHVIALGTQAPNSNTVIGCVRVNAYVAIPNDPLPLFWHTSDNNPFFIRWYGQTIAECPAYNPITSTTAELVCEFSLPQSNN
ncbi:MAG: hypothetical protein CUN55_09395 [Phototrophicales bacterium]|nr:MAG: hypothetical protein CUN55_09395 [Phototrophicales bacterium]